MNGKYTIAGGKVFDQSGSVVGRVDRSGKISMFAQSVSETIDQAADRTPIYGEKNSATGVFELSAAGKSILGRLNRAATSARSRNVLNEQDTTACAVTGGLWVADLANVVQLSTNRSRFLTEGGVFVDNGNALEYPLKSATVGMGNIQNAVGAFCLRNAISFVTSASKVQMKSYIGGGDTQFSNIRIKVEVAAARGANLAGKVGSKALALTGRPAGDTNFILIDFSNYGGAGIDRLVTIDWENFLPANISYDTGYLAPPPTEKPRACFFGDSHFANGAGYAKGTNLISNIASRIGDQLGWAVTCCAVGGTGYTNNGGSNYTFNSPQRISDLSLQPFDVFVFAGGTNDGNSTALSIKTSALDLFRAARTARPGARIYAIGCWNAELFPGTLTQQQVEQAVKSAFDEFADGNSKFIPVSTDPSGPWITPANKAMYIDSDNTHARPQVGERYFADRVVQIIRDDLLA
jgi:hypothetical protein